MINKLPIIGWVISFLANASIAIPFWICWTFCSLGKDYFYFLPEKFQSIPFWNCVGLFMIVSMLKVLFPCFVSVNNSNSK